MIIIHYHTKPHNKWTSRSEPGDDGVRITIEYGRDEFDSTEDVLMERAKKFSKQMVRWLTPMMSYWKIDCEEMKKSFPSLEFPNWFKEELTATPIFGHERRRFTTIEDGRQGVNRVLRLSFHVMSPIGFRT